MSNTCSICISKERVNIDKEIVSGRPLAMVAREFCVPYSSLWAHAQDHVAKSIVRAHQKQEVVNANDLMERIDQIIRRTERIFTRNYEAGKDLTALKALAEQRSTIDLLAKISYQLHQAKMAEIQLLQEQKKNIHSDEADIIQEALYELTFDELKMYQTLQRRIIDIINKSSKKR